MEGLRRRWLGRSLASGEMALIVGRCSWRRLENSSNDFRPAGWNFSGRASWSLQDFQGSKVTFKAATLAAKWQGKRLIRTDCWFVF